MLTPSVIAIIISYHPNISDVLSTIQAISLEVEEVLIVDNSETYVDWRLLDDYANVTVIINGINYGVAKGLNIALQYALKKHYDYALLLDQDSLPQSNFVSCLLAGFSVCPNVIITTPRIVDVNNKDSQVKCFNKFDTVVFAITSGSLLNLRYLSLTGMFDEALFIDYVDFEFCLRAKRSKLTIIRCNDAVLKHSLGNMKEVKFMGFRLYPTNHSPLRQYYKIRNRLYVCRNYFKDNKIFVIKNTVRSIIDVFYIIAFENDKFSKLKFIAIGVKDALRSNYGCYHH